MKVDVAGLMAAAQRLKDAALLVQGTGPGELTPLSPDTTSAGAAARLQAASLELWGSASAQAASLASAAAHLVMIAAKFATQEEANRFNIAGLQVTTAGLDTAALTTLEPMPPLAPDVRLPLPPLGANVNGEAFSQMVTLSSGDGTAFTTNATNNGTSADSVARTLRELAATVPDMWDSPEGTAALAGRLTEHATAITAISDRWFQLGDETRKHADDHGQAVGAVPKPAEFKENEARLREAQQANNGIAASQLLFQRGELLQRAVAVAQRYAADTEVTTSPKGAPTPAAPGGGSRCRHPGRRRRTGRRTRWRTAIGQGGGDRSSAGRPGGRRSRPAGAAHSPGAGRHRRYRGRHGGHGGPDPAGPHADRSGAGADRHPGVVRFDLEECLRRRTGQGGWRSETRGAFEGKGRRRGRRWRCGRWRNAPGGCTRPTGHSVDVPHATDRARRGIGAAAARRPHVAARWVPCPMGMPMGGLMPHGAHGGGDGAADKVAADKKVVVPPQAHTEPVTGKVSDRTAAAAEAARARTESDDHDDEPPRGPVMRRITLAPLQDDGP